MRAAQVRGSVHDNPGPIELRVDDLLGSDELGVLADALSDLMLRINEDVRREQARVSQARDMWHAVGHEIMAPLQSLSALHEHSEDPSRRYVQRMQQAVRVLYGSAAPAEAIASANVQSGVLDLRAFLVHVAANAADAGIADVQFEGPDQAVTVKADEYPLEDVITHVLTNADRHRLPGTSIRLELAVGPDIAQVSIHNQGRSIPPEQIERIFEYGVSEPAPESGMLTSQRGQGLFVARTYMAKMGGTIKAQNLPDGVAFILTLGLG